MTDLTTEQLDEIERRAKAAQQTFWDGRFAGSNITIEADNALGFCFGPINYPVCDLSVVDGYPRLGKGLVAVAFGPKDQEHIAACNPPTVLALVAMARGKAEAEKLCLVKDGAIEALQKQDHRNRSLNRDLAIKVAQTEADRDRLRWQIETLRGAP